MLPALAEADGPMLPPEVMAHVARPWPPTGWSEVLDLPNRGSTEAHRSEPRKGPGYFGQSLYRQISGTSRYWTANVLILDRGSASAAWRAVSAVSCRSRVYQGNRARECQRSGFGGLTRTLHYEVGRYYVTIQLSGPGEMDYPHFTLVDADDPDGEPGFFGPLW